MKEPAVPVEPPQFTTPEPRLETYTADIFQFKLTLSKWLGWLGVCRGEKRKLEQRTEQYNTDHGAWAKSKIQFYRSDEYKKADTKYTREHGDYPRRKVEYQLWLDQVTNAEQREPTLEAALEANAARRREVKEAETRENAYREAASREIQSVRRLAEMDHTMDAIFAPRPREVNPVVSEKKGGGVSLDRQEFAEIVSHGYDLPENCKLTPREAASINLLVSGATSVNQPVFEKLNPFDPVAAKMKPQNGLNMIVTGLFGTSRHSQEWIMVHAGFDAAKDAIQEYQNGKPEKLGGYLGEGLRNLVNGFDAASISGLDYTSGALVTKRVLEVLDDHPDLMACAGLTEKELQDARGSAALGGISLNGMKAKKLLQQADAGLRELTPEEKGRCMADLTLLNLSERAVETERENFQNSRKVRRRRQGCRKAW